MVVPVLSHEVKARWGYFTFSRIQLPALCVYVEGAVGRDNDLECSRRAHDLWLGFRLQFTQCRKEAAKSLPALKPRQNSFMHLELNHWRCHGQLSRSCVPNLSCNHFVAASGPTIWTSTFGLEPVLCNRLLIEPSSWAQTVHMFTQRFT